MTEENIRKMVEKYEIKDNRDGRIRAYHVKTDEEKKQIGEHKAEILAYLKREEEKKKEEYLRKNSFFESIPGVKEIRKAREEWRDYQFDLYYVMYGIDYRRTGYDEVRELQILLLRFFGRDFGMRTV